MANSMDYDLEGMKVILKGGILKPEFNSVEWRTVRVLGGFGSKGFTVGRALYVQFQDGEQTRMDGYDVDSTETLNLWKVEYPGDYNKVIDLHPSLNPDNKK